MSTTHKPPEAISSISKNSVFLAGTIDNGNSTDWQLEVEKNLEYLNIDILNPRRDEWDPTWEQSIRNPIFKEQVDWEMHGLDMVDHIFFYFAAGSLSPITLLELGLHADDNPVVVCPDGFWRKGNVEMVAHTHGFPVYDTIAEGIAELKERML